MVRSCNCSYPGCSRHGICCKCIAYHRAMNELPACYFTAEEERTYNLGEAKYQGYLSENQASARSVFPISVSLKMK